MRKLSLRSFTSFLIARWTKPSPITTKCRKDSARPFSRTTSAKPSNSCPAAAAIAASPTSTSAPAAPKSAVPLAAKRRPAAGVKAAVTPGKPTCAGKPHHQLLQRPAPGAGNCVWLKLYHWIFFPAGSPYRYELDPFSSQRDPHQSDRRPSHQPHQQTRPPQPLRHQCPRHLGA